MKEPLITIFESLQYNVEKAFAVVINDNPLVVNNKQVFVKLQESRVLFYTKQYMREIQSTREIYVDMAPVWNNLRENTTYAGVSFEELYGKTAACNVIINDEFRVIFINSPLNVFIKRIIAWLGVKGNTITRIQITEYPELVPNLIDHWGDILSHFQAETIVKYIVAYELLYKRLVLTKLRQNYNRVFRNKIGKDVNMLHLFFKMNGVYNPFLDDSTLLRFAPKHNWLFSADESNHRLFVRECKGFTLHCMTPTSFCRSIGLEYKLNFDTSSALLLLGGLLFHGNISVLELPNKATYGYLVVEYDPETDIVTDHKFLLTVPDSSQLTGFERITKINSLEYFCLTRVRALCDDKLSKNELFAILSKANIVSRSD